MVKTCRRRLGIGAFAGKKIDGWKMKKLRKRSCPTF
jgi:hypothetical protein